MNDIKTAIALVETGQVEEAYELLQTIVHQSTDDEKFVIIELFEEWGYFEDAAQLLTDMLLRYPNEGQLIIKLSEINIELDQNEQAINLLYEINEHYLFYMHSLLRRAVNYEREELFEVAEQKLL